MRILEAVWTKLTQTKSLENSSGELETAFFGSVYRVAYITGLSGSDMSMLYLLYSNTIKFMFVLLVCGEIWYTCTLASTLDELAASVNCLVCQFVTLYRYRNMLTHQYIYKKLAMAMESPYFDISTDNRKKIVEYWAKRNERYLKLLLIIGNLTLAAWFLYPLADDVEYNLIVLVRLPFNYRGSRGYYAFAYLIVVITFAYTSYFVMVTDINIQAYLLHLICQLHVLGDCFENIVYDCQKDLKKSKQQSLSLNITFAETYKKRLRELTEQHRFLLRLIMELRETLSGAMLGQLLGSGTLICFIGYQAATTITEDITKCLMSLFYLGYNLFVFYVICRWCEEITIQSERIGTAAYCSGWESGISIIPSVRSSLLLVVARANKPLILTAGGMYDLSLMSYSSLVKTSYTALTVLLRFR